MYAAPAPFKKRSFSGTIAALTSAVASTDPIRVSGDVSCEKNPPPKAGETGRRWPDGDLKYSGRFSIPKARSRGMVVGYAYRLAIPGDDVTAPLDVSIKFVGTPDLSDANVVAVDFVGQDAHSLVLA